MTILSLILHNLLSFILIISFIVFIHELGHFLVARLCGVKVDEFSIGFGRELCGFFDKKGTRWKICLLPLGGYVKMHGDKNGMSIPDIEAIEKMSPSERKISFLGKNVFQRMAIVASGPLANFLLAILLFGFLFKANGINTVLPIISEVSPQSAAMEAGLKKGDKILAINRKEISDFNQVREATIDTGFQELSFEIKRGEEILTIKITPRMEVRKDFFGEEKKMKTIGIMASEVSHQDLNLLQSFREGAKETAHISTAIFKALGQLITGKRSLEELGGPIKIAQYSGKTVDMGIYVVIWFTAMISVNLGVMNILPVPVLDGGHLFFYIIEAIMGKPLSRQAQQIGFRIGLSLVMALIIFTTLNDLRQLFK